MQKLNKNIANLKQQQLCGYWSYVQNSKWFESRM